MAISDARFALRPRGLVALVAVLLLLQSFAVSASGLGHISADGPAFERLCANNAVDTPLGAAAGHIAHRFCVLCAAVRRADPLGFDAPWRAVAQDTTGEPLRVFLALRPPGWMSSWSSQAPPHRA